MRSVATTDLPAIAGGRPMFEELLPIVSPEGLPGEKFLRDVQQILRSRQLTNASFVRDFETAAATYLGVPHCVAVSSCTLGLALTLRALDLHGDVIVPSFTFHATVHSIVWNGLSPVFADCDPETFCVNPESVCDRLSPRTAAILGVHLFGSPAPVKELEEIAERARVPLIFDAAHSFGSMVKEKRVGTFGAAEVFSFSPTKLVVAGEGGLIATWDGGLAQSLRAARNYGDAGNYDPGLFGLNARMSEFHAALALRGLESLEGRLARRNQIRLQYERRLAVVPGLSFQRTQAGNRSTCQYFSVLVEEKSFGRSRDWLFNVLRKENIDARRYFWPPVHRQQLFGKLWDGQPLPVTDHVSECILNLPIYTSLCEEDVDKVVDAILRAHEYANRTGMAKGQSAG